MAQTDFDKYFLNLPPMTREKDFLSFWKKSLSDTKKIPLETELIQTQKSSAAFTWYNVTFRSFMKTQISARLARPKGVKKPRVIILVHDYNGTPEYPVRLLKNDVAYFMLQLRGHGIINRDDAEQKSPGYMFENILDRETYYMKALYLDLLRSIDLLRLMADLDCSNLAIIGKGVGAAIALAAAAFSDRVKALVLDTPSFCHLPLSQNISTGDAAQEINDFIATTRGKKKQIKANLTYFDALHFADMVTCPVLTTVGFKDTIAPPQCIFSLFNHLLCEKTIEVYPDEGNSAGGDEQFKKSIQWALDQIMK